MPRAPFQVLVIPYRITAGQSLRYALLKRNEVTGGYWQGIAGGGEEGESPVEAARREAQEEAGIEPSRPFLSLDARVMIPVVNVSGFLWGEQTLLIPEYGFGVELEDERLVLSDEHTEYRWLSYVEARDSLRWESNRVALWELDHRLRRQLCLPSEPSQAE